MANISCSRSRIFDRQQIPAFSFDEAVWVVFACQLHGDQVYLRQLAGLKLSAAITLAYPENTNGIAARPDRPKSTRTEAIDTNMVGR